MNYPGDDKVYPGVDKIDPNLLPEEIMKAAQLVALGAEKMVSMEKDNAKILEAQGDQINTNRRRTIILIISVVFDIMLSIIILGYQGKFETQRVSAEKACLQANESRKADRELWEFILNAPTTRQRTPQELETAQKFRDLVNKKDALRDCKAASSKNPIVTIPTTTGVIK